MLLEGLGQIPVDQPVVLDVCPQLRCGVDTAKPHPRHQVRGIDYPSGVRTRHAFALLSPFFKPAGRVQPSLDRMPTEISQLLEAAAGMALPVVQKIDESQFSDPTPCDEYQVRDLLNHLFLVVVNFQALAARMPADFTSKPDFLGEGWRDRFAVETRQLVDAWSDPEALQGVSLGMGLPQPTVGRLVLLDLTVHAWDLAVATGQSFHPDPGAVTSLHGLLAELGDLPRKTKVFGEPYPVPGGNGFESLLGLAGRNPNWGRIE